MLKLYFGKCHSLLLPFNDPLSATILKFRLHIKITFVFIYDTVFCLSFVF